MKERRIHHHLDDERERMPGTQSYDKSESSCAILDEKESRDIQEDAATEH